LKLKNFYEINFYLFFSHIYDMDLQTDPYRGVGLGINVLKGLVRINLLRNRNPFSGEKSGPISVEVGGVPIFGKSH
jgi:hypothetical protein